MSKINFVIFEKSYLIRLGLISLVKEIHGAEIHGDYGTIDHFSSIIRNKEPDIIIINEELYGNVNLQTLKNLSDEYNFKLIGITGTKKESSYPAFSTFFCYLEKKAEILKEIDEVINQLSGNKKKFKSNNKISEREIAILECVAKGLTNKEIAEKLFISAHTVITHRKNIVRKLGIKTVSGLTVYAILNKIIDMTDLK